MENSVSELNDREITCTGCGDLFVWTIGEQEYFTRVGLGTTPKRCKPCRAEKRARYASREASIE
jgi:Probable zinc-ribbon domain